MTARRKIDPEIEKEIDTAADALVDRLQRSCVLRKVAGEFFIAAFFKDLIVDDHGTFLATR